MEIERVCKNITKLNKENQNIVKIRNNLRIEVEEQK